MTPGARRFRTARLLFIAGAALVSTGVAGCAATPPAPPDSPATPSAATAQPPSENGTASDASNPADDPSSNAGRPSEDQLVQGVPDGKNSPDDAASPGSIDATIALAIELLLAKDYRGLFERVLDPEDFKKMTAKENLDAMVKEFGESNKPKELLEILRALGGVTPQMTDDGHAIFEREGARDLRFRRIGGRWYLRN